MRAVSSIIDCTVLRTWEASEEALRLGYPDSTPGVLFEQVLADAPVSYARSLLGERSCHLLDLVDGGSASSGRIQEVAAAAVDPEQLLADPAARSEFLTHLSQVKLRELAHRLGMDPEEHSLTENIPWTKAQLRTLLGFLGQIVDRAPAEPTPSRRECTPTYGLFPHQRDVSQEVRAALNSDERRTVLHLPTGVGKTRTAMHVIADHLRDREESLVVWLGHGQELLEQAAGEFEQAWGAVGDRPVAIARMWGDASVELDALRSGLVVLGIEKATAADRADPRFLDQLGSRTTLTVFDEAHQAIAPTYRRVIDALTLRPDSSLLGLTATPGRTWADISADEQLAELFARQKVMLNIEGYSNPVTALIEQAYLARPTFRTVASESGLSITADDRRALAASFDLPDQLVTRLADDVQWNLQVIRTVLELTERHRRILVFAASVSHCRLLSAIVSGAGVDCQDITAETSTRRRSQAIGRFKSESPRPLVLCNYGVLTTGFDAPAASAAVIARPTRSLVLYSQMVGRVIRGPKAGGTPTCEMVTVVDPELPGFGDVADAFTNWEDVWEEQ